jgi:hypothetical protein
LQFVFDGERFVWFVGSKCFHTGRFRRAHFNGDRTSAHRLPLFVFEDRAFPITKKKVVARITHFGLILPAPHILD